MIYSSEKGDLLTFRESLELSFAREGMPNEAEWESFDDAGFKLVENTPEEISEVAIEMDQRLESTFEESEEDRELQRRWLSIVLSYPKIITLEPGLDKRLKIGSHFLRSHPGWLD
jgi:putative glycosyltransferase (TIGR04372 family)